MRKFKDEEVSRILSEACGAGLQGGGGNPPCLVQAALNTDGGHEPGWRKVERAFDSWFWRQEGSGWTGTYLVKDPDVVMEYLQRRGLISPP